MSLSRHSIDDIVFQIARGVTYFDADTQIQTIIPAHIMVLGNMGSMW